MIQAWESGKTYSPGALVRPASASAPTTTPVANGDFENGAVSWDFPTGWSVVTDVNYSGTHSAKYSNNGGGQMVNTVRVPVSPGFTITGSVMIALDHNDSHVSAARAVLCWYDSAGTLIETTQSPIIGKSFDGAWQKSTVTGSAPANAVTAAIGVGVNADGQSFVRADFATWDYVYQGDPTGLIFKAVQDSPGKSGSSEPVWPAVNGQTVIDNEVIWESVLASRLVWQASPLMMSGPLEPSWPVVVGAYVQDGTVNWETTTPRITDVNCPNSKIVAIAASKVYAADKDIIRYCCTVNPLDWTTKEDAGYLPYGLQTYGANDVAAMNLYRSNLAAFNAEGMQLWQVDEDPAQTALLDALPVGSTQNQALSPVANDLIFLSSQGVRSIGVTSSSTNLQAGDIGMPIDPLVKEAVKESATAPLATYVPSLGQYWLAIAAPDTPGPTISGSIGNGKIGDVVDFHYVITASGTYTVTLISGSLPDGLVMDATGHVTGTRTYAGEFVPVIRVEDQQGRTVSKTDPSTTVGSGLPPHLSDWRYFTTTLSDNTDRSAPTFNDSAWPLGTAPFGNLVNNPSAGDAAHAYDARLSATMGTQIPLDGRCWIRRTMTLMTVPANGFRMIGYFDNAFQLYINGVLAASGNSSIAAGVTQDFPASLFMAGANVIAVKCDDDAAHVPTDTSYFDFLLDEIP